MKHDDVVDGLSYQGILIDLMTEGLTKEELDTEQYEQEVNESGYNEEGRDEVTGY